MKEGLTKNVDETMWLEIQFRLASEGSLLDKIGLQARLFGRDEETSANATDTNAVP